MDKYSLAKHTFAIAQLLAMLTAFGGNGNCVCSTSAQMRHFTEVC
jgi:hypothetical protein